MLAQYRVSFGETKWSHINAPAFMAANLHVSRGGVFSVNPISKSDDNKK